MLTLGMLFWIGQTLVAPTWYWWVWGICAVLIIIQYGIKCVKLGEKL